MAGTESRNRNVAILGYESKKEGFSGKSSFGNRERRTTASVKSTDEKGSGNAKGNGNVEICCFRPKP